MKKKQWLILAVGAALIISLFMENRGCYRQTCGTGGGNGKPEAGLTGETGNLSAGKDTDPADPEARSTDGANRVADGKSGPTESTENRGINTLEQAVAMVNDNLPVEITGDLRYDSVRIEDGKIYHHYYTFTGPESGLKASLERTAG
ncbi:MAG: hypothetical protein LIO85_10305 [Rikenellaceae bacterium]|nr:hypothetical protein [Rikenellaceae bacterium]